MNELQDQSFLEKCLSKTRAVELLLTRVTNILWITKNLYSEHNLLPETLYVCML